jgi:hypothetical protein
LTEKEWTHITEPEMLTLLSDVNLSPIPESRQRIIQARLGSRLITCDDVRQILVLMGTNEERVATLRALSGNVSDPSSNWDPVHALITDPELRAEAIRVTGPARRQPEQA